MSIGKIIKCFLIFICSFKIIIHMFVFAIIFVIWLPYKRTNMCCEWLDILRWTFWFELICYLDGAAIATKSKSRTIIPAFWKIFQTSFFWKSVVLDIEIFGKWAYLRYLRFTHPNLFFHCPVLGVSFYWHRKCKTAGSFNYWILFILCFYVDM